MDQAKGYIPKEGDKVRFLEEFLRKHEEYWEQPGKGEGDISFDYELARQTTFKIVGKIRTGDQFYIYFSPGPWLLKESGKPQEEEEQYLGICAETGLFLQPKVPIFCLATDNSYTYCQCPIPNTVTSNALGKAFQYCRKCKKEKV